MYSIILCGGSGTRLWPLSKGDNPKQFLKLYSKKSLLQETYLRMKDIMPVENIFFVSNGEEPTKKVAEQIREIEKDFDASRVLIEPAKKNTAPAIVLAMKALDEKFGVGKNSPIIILPSDHYIGNKDAYLRIVKQALAQTGKNIGTIGITPTKPETGYGYIKKGRRFGEYFEALEFREKPDIETAKRYIEDGSYAWNSGMYIFSTDTFLREIKKHAPEIASFMEKDWDNFLKDFESMPSISIDYAISEKSDKVVVFEGEFGWSDIGSFDSLAEILSKDGKTSNKHIKIGSEDVFIHSTGGKTIAVVGVNNLIVVEDGDSILITEKGKSEGVRDIVKHLEKSDKNK